MNVRLNCAIIRGRVRVCSPAVQHFGNVGRSMARDHEPDKKIPVSTSLRSAIAVSSQFQGLLAVDHSQMRDVGGIQKEHRIPVWFEIGLEESCSDHLVFIGVEQWRISRPAEKRTDYLESVRI